MASHFIIILITHHNTPYHQQKFNFIFLAYCYHFFETDFHTSSCLFGR